jgi:chromosome segregation ATPase
MDQPGQAPGMSKLPISIAVTATLIATAACDRDKIKREARDVEDAREDLREQEREQQREVGEAQAELEKEKAELALEVQKQVNELEERFLEIEKDSAATLARLEADGTRSTQIAEIEQARNLARTRINAARDAATAEEARQNIAAAEQALDAYDRKVDQYANV